MCGYSGKDRNGGAFDIQAEMQEIEQVRAKNKDKRIEARLKALELRAKGASLQEVANATGFKAATISWLVQKYRDHGLSALVDSHYHGNRRNMSIEQEAAILGQYHTEKSARYPQV